VQALLENIPVMIAIHDLDARTLYINTECERLLGYTEQEVREHPSWIEALLTDPAELEPALEFVKSADRRWVELPTVAKDGRIVPSLWMSMRVEDFIIGIGIDLTERKAHELAAQRAREEVEARVERRIPAANAYGLSFRELTVLMLVAGGKTDREIADLLSIGIRTVQTHISNILTKMNANVRTEAAIRAVREGIID
jgi:PAS domain S-box-containing protein